MSDENEWKKAPTEEKVEHKNWKARQEGYEECCKLFRHVDDQKNPVYSNYLGLVKKFVVDTNEVAKDKGLDAVLLFVENVNAAAKTVGEVVPGLINKCLNGKPKTKEKAFQIIMMYIEAEKQETVQEELIKGLENKQPKIVQACLEILRMSINDFGSKVMPIKPIIKFVPKLLEDRDQTVREETKKLVIEMYRWAGAAIMPQLQQVKPALLEELQEGFKNASSGEKPRQTRFLRSQQDLKAKMEAELEQKMMNGDSGGGSGGVNQDGGGGDDGAAEAIDPYDLMDPCDILSKLPKDFKEKLESKKWQERKEVLDALLSVLEKNPRLVVTDYYELVNDLKKLVAKDANVNIVTTAAKCICNIAKGLRKDFSKYALLAMEPLMERFKEKKQHIVDILREACDAIYPSTNLEAISEMCVGYLAHKTPVVRQNVALFLARCFAMSTQTTLPKKTLKLYLPALVTNLSEADPAVRESSSEALGAIYKTLGEKIFMPQIGEIEAIKLDKIKEFADKCVLLNLRGEPRGGAVAATAAVSKPVEQTKKIETKKPEVDAKKSKPDEKPKPGTAKPNVIKGGNNKAAGGGDSKKPSAAPEEPDMSQDVIDEKCVEIFGAECINGLANSNWKERQTAMETMLTKIKSMPSDEVPCQLIVRTVAKKPGFKDAHFQVLKQRLELITFIADQGFKFSQRSASYCLADIADKISDPKTAQQAKDALSKIAEQCTLPYVCTQLLGPIMEGKNPKNQEHFFTWLAQAIKEFGFQGIDLKSLIPHLKSALSNSNASVRQASVLLISVIYMYAGPSFQGLFDTEKPALKDQIAAEIEKVKDSKPPVPIRGKNVPNSKTGGSAENGDDGGGDEAAADDPVQLQLQQEALFPRVDISGLLDDALMEQMNDKNWKERQAALEKIENILRDNKFIEPNLNEFPTNLNKRLTDTNKILATTSLKISEKLAQALGSQGKRYVSVLAPGMIAALQDNKEALRKTALSALNAWFDNCGGLLPFIEGEFLMEQFSKATNPNVKSELCGWLAQVLPKCKKGKLPPELKAIIPSVYLFIEDRSPEVRTKSQELLLPLMEHVGPNDMLRVMQKSKPASIAVIQPLIDKVREQLAEKIKAEQPKNTAKPASSVQASSAPAAEKKVPPSKSKQNLYDPNTDPEDEAPPEKKEPIKKDSKDAKKVKENEKKPGTASQTNVTKKPKPGEEEDSSPIMQVSNKNKRVDEEKALKTLKWNFDVPRKEFIEQLKTQMENANFNRTLLTQMFHDDFQKHIIALNALTKANEDLSDATLSNLDLILRWLTLRFFETNPTVILKAIEYMKALFTMLASKGYHLIEYEAAAFVPYFIGKLGDPKDPIRKGFREIIKLIVNVYAPVKVFNFLIQGLVSKNARQRTECLEELGSMIEALGLDPFNPQVTLKEIAKQIGDRDNSVRSAALDTCTMAFRIAGEKVYKYVGKLNEKDQSMLDERIKRSAKLPPPKSVSNGNLNQEKQQQQQPQSSQKEEQIQKKENQNTQLPPSLPPNATNGNHHNTSGSEEKFSSTTITRPSRIGGNTPKKFTSRSDTQPIISTQTKQKGEFCLDIPDDDDEQNGIIQVKTTQHKDLDDLLYQPIGLPPPRKNNTSYPINILKESQDCKEAIDLVITHISHQNIDISFQNLVQIDVVVKDREKKDLLIPHIDNLLNTCALKLNVAHNVYLNSRDCPVEDVFKLFKGLFTVIIDIFDSDLGKHTSSKTLKDVFNNLLCVMTDVKILNYPDGDQLIKAINIVTLKLLELSDQTTSYCALVKLLSECCDHENFSSKYLELVMKCIWRQIRRLSATNTNSATIQAYETLVSQIDTSKVLQEIHLFLRLFPSTSWNGKQSDLPLRTVKTLLFHLAKAKQKQILVDLQKINVPDDSEIKIYINKLFKNGFQLSANNQNNNTSTVNMSHVSTSNNSLLGMNQFKKPQLNSENSKTYSPNQQSPTSSSSSSSSSSSNPIGDQLSLIIKKISNQETSKEGINELYDFKLQNTEIDLNKYFKNSSGKLQSYIQENLRLVEIERNNQNKANDDRTHFIKNGAIKKSPNSQTDDPKGPLNRNVDDIMKTIADWKSKTHLNQLNDDDNDENNLRSASALSNGGSRYNADSRLNNMHSGSNGRLFQPSTNGPNYVPESENSIKAEKYLDIVKDLKKKYTRSRTEPLHMQKPAEDESDQLSDLKQLDLKAKNLCENSASNSNLSHLQQNSSSNGEAHSSNQSNSSHVPPAENLYDEYKRRLELIKKIKQVK